MREFLKSMTVAALTMVGTSALAAPAAPPATGSSPPSQEDLIARLGKSNPTQGANRGIKLGGTAATTPTAPRAEPVHRLPQSAMVYTPPPPPSSETPSGVNLTVTFRTGSAELTPAARAWLDPLGGALNSPQLKGFRYRIEGHTDNVGDPQRNLALSQQRAEAVVTYLANQFKVEPARLQAVGKGDTEPLVAAPPQTPEEKNRRVQVINIGG